MPSLGSWEELLRRVHRGHVSFDGRLGAVAAAVVCAAETLFANALATHALHRPTVGVAAEHDAASARVSATGVHGMSCALLANPVYGAVARFATALPS